VGAGSESNGAGDLRARKNASQAQVAALVKAHKGAEEVHKLKRENDLAEGKRSRARRSSGRASPRCLP
jgi:hypothetical protein